MSSENDSVRSAWVQRTLDRYERPLTRYAARITGDVETARDVVQDVFLKLCADTKARSNGHLPQWLYTVCRNRALDAQRKNGRQQPLSEQQAARQPATDGEPCGAAMKREGAGRMLGALATLPENQQEVLRLRFSHGLSYKEVAVVTGLSVSNVGYLIHTGIKSLRELLDPG